ncbi:hypothetical protein TL18_00805 [Methanobrevibacter sp. YE315]|uniref:Ig-like domain repeat protein n=1 Tax=Methanobrevibacter sp. YE315 TaxID=1609968 RepID=UPI000764D757|nr:Ig-like domain repeat protein [Methanobrevibacter sp. YE315]AMD16705.1 hypothetical protein TL18_00805 [Methanobrevibacter sp. YE315]
MKLNKILLVSIILLFIFTLGAVSAADENITDTTDEVLSADPVDEVLSINSTDELESAQQGDFTELKSLVSGTSSGKTLTLEKDYVIDESGGYVEITKAINIDGQGHTIYGNNMKRIFVVNSQNVVLKNINFVNGYCGILSNEKNCRAINCSFVNCSSDYGGAIDGGNAYNCTFVNCFARMSGGAIDGGNAYNCTFVNCTTKNSNAAIVWGDDYNCTFVNCRNNAAIQSILVSSGNYIRISVAGDGRAPGNVNITANGKTKVVKTGWGYFDLGYLDVGLYNVTVSYAGSDKFEAQTITSTFEVTKIDPIYGIEVKGMNNGEYYYDGKNATLNIMMNYNNVPGNVHIEVNGITQKIKIKTSYNIYVDLGVLNLGINNIKVSYAGSANYNAQTENISFNVVKKNPIKSIYVTGLNVNYNRNVTFINENSSLKILMFDDSVPGNVHITINGVTQTIKTSSGSGYSYDYYLLIPLGVLNVGSYDIKVSYAGSAYFSAQTKALTFNVLKTDPIFLFRIVNPYISENMKKVEFSFTSARLAIALKNNNVPGYFNVTIDGISKIVNINGRSSISIPLGILKLGSHNIVATYAGDTNYNAQTKTMAFKVNKCNPISYIKAYNYYNYVSYDKKEVAYDGENPTLDISLKSNRVPGNLHITVNGASHKVLKTSNTTSLSIPLNVLKVGVNDIKVSYAGSAYFAAQDVTLSITVVKATPISSVNMSNQVGFGDNATITAIMSSSKINGNVWFTISDASNTKILTDKIHIENGVATQSVSGLKLGKYKVHIYYAGSTNYNAQTIKDTFEVVKGTPINSVEVSNWAPGKDVTVKVNVKNINGNIWFTISDANKTTIFSNKSSIENNWANISIPGLSVGSYNLHVYYSGNAYYNTQTIKSSFEVAKISPELSVSKATVDGKTVLTASIAEDAPGNVKFEVNGSTYKAQIVKGVATLTLSDLAPGTYTLKTSYAGNYKYLAETKTRSITIK